MTVPEDRADALVYPSVIAILGPTAVGKSALALELAGELEADIVTADSRQVYRYMDIGTAKPSLADQARARHYMIDLVPPDEGYSAHRYREEGRRVLRRLGAAGRVALVVGGTGFYVRALLEEVSLAEVPPNPLLRVRLRQQAEAEGAGALHHRLAELDPRSAERVHPNNLPRVIRALEIVAALGGPVPPPVGRPSVAGSPAVVPALYLGLTMDRTMLREIANRRVLGQVEAGLVEEARLLLEMGYAPSLPALQGFAYRQMIAYLEGRCSLEEAITSYQTASHQYIRRQLTWFRADPRIQWIDAGDRPGAIARELAARWLAKGAAASSPGRVPSVPSVSPHPDAASSPGTG